MLNYIGVMAMVIIGLISCNSDAVKPTIKSAVGTNTLNATPASSYVLQLGNATDTLKIFSWTATDFGFSSSVTYKLQMDKSDGDFSNPVELASLNNNKLLAPLAVKDLNQKILALGSIPNSAANVKLRVVSSISDKVSPVYSNVITVAITPYATSFPPIFAMGDALNGWGPWPDNELILSGTTYQVYKSVVHLSNGKAFRFFAQQDWNPTSYNFTYFTTVDNNFTNANDGDKNFKFTGTDGFYQLSVDMNTKTVALTPVNEPLLYMVGQAVGGWDQALAVKMTFIRDGVFQGTTTFTNSGPASTFRFFAQHDWSPTSYSYPYFTTVDSHFVNANDGDKNLQFTGTTGTYTVIVNLNDKTVVLH